MEPVLKTSTEIAAVLGCSKAMVERLQKAGKLPCVRIGRLVRYRLEDIDKWMEDGGSTAA